MSSPAIPAALMWLEANDVRLPSDLVTKLQAKGYAVKADALTAINKTYHDAITQALLDYFESGGAVTSYRNQFKARMSDAFVNAFELGYMDGGAELPLDEDALDWLAARQEAEFGFIGELFAQAKQLKKEEGFDFFAWATARADGYTSTLAAIYNAAKMFARKNQMLIWNLGNTEKHCSTCAKLDGGSHRAKWYLARDYIPRKPGAAMECGGYKCDCSLTDSEGNEVTI